MQTFPKLQAPFLFAARLITAAVFLYAAYAKFPLWSATVEASGMPAWLYYMMLFLSVAEVVGALALILGCMTRLAALCLGIVMIGAIFVMHYTMGMDFASATGAGWNFPFAVLGTCCALIATGAGNWSLDSKFCK